MEYTFKPVGVCSNEIQFTLEGGVVTAVAFQNGCDGNAKGLSKLAEGMKAEEVIKALSGIRCGRKQTSCPDQLAAAIKKAMDNK